MGKDSHFLAFLSQDCPRCHKGKIFEKHSYHPKFMRMHEKCPVCDYKFEIEPGFFWGSMYVNYAFSVGIGLVSGILTYYLLNDPPVWVYMGIITSLLALLSPLIFRFGRVVFIYVFSPVKYEPGVGWGDL